MGVQNGHTYGEEEHHRKSEEKNGRRGEVGRRHGPRHCRAGDSRGGRGSRRRGVDAHRPGVARRGEIGGGGGPAARITPAAPGETGEERRESQEGAGEACEEEESGTPAFVALTATNIVPGWGSAQDPAVI